MMRVATAMMENKEITTTLNKCVYLKVLRKIMKKDIL